MVKRWQRILIVVAIVIVVIFAGSYMYLKSSLENLVSMEVDYIEITQLKDGSYIGEYSVLPVSVTVEVKIANGRIKDINILDHGNGMGQPAEVITERVIDEQSLEVDSISGATYSSRVIIKAIENGLNKAK